MTGFFRKLFARAHKPVHRPRPLRPTLEALETRALPNAGPWSPAFFRGGLADHARFGAALSGATDPSSPCGAEGQTTSLTATLTGSSGASGTVTFRSNATTGDNSLSVRVSGLSADATYTVTSGTTTIGTITADANGVGRLSVSDLSPALASGADITVTDSTGATVLSGTLATPAGPTRLSAGLTGATGTSGGAHFFADAAGAQNALLVRVSGLAADTEYTVEVDGTTVGQLATNANGNGRFMANGLTDTVAAGSTVTILDSSGDVVLQGTFTADSNVHGGRRHG